MKQKPSPSRSVARRAEYANDPGTANTIRSQSREKYHGGSRPPAKLANGLMTSGEVREVQTGEMDHPETVESFSIPQAALALGRSEATMRRWIAGDKIPAPYLQDVRTHHMVYSVGELEVIARIIARHEQEFLYLVAEHTHIVETLQQAVHAYRAEFI